MEKVELIICIVILALFFIIWLVWQIKKKGLRIFVTECIVEAEDKFIKGANEGKLNYVIDKVISVIPMPLSLFITREIVKEFVQKCFDVVKQALDYKEG